VDQRIPKKTLVEHGTNSSADKKLVQDGIEELFWVAALKPHNVGIPEYRDESRTYGEIAVLSLVARPSGRRNRLVELIHRAIPYPTLLFGQQDDIVFASVAQKRNALNQADAVVIDGEPFIVDWPQVETGNPPVSAFLQALSLSCAPRKNLLETCHHWRNQMIGLRSAQLTGIYVPAITDSDAKVREASLARIESLQAEIAALRAQAGRERTMSRRVDLNLSVQRHESELSELKRELRDGRAVFIPASRNEQ
jgi:hypothetical protein